MKKLLLLIPALYLMSSCGTTSVSQSNQVPVNVDKYTSFTLTTDLSQLSANERKMLPYLMKAADIMNELFWYEAYGKKNALLDYLKGDAKKFAEINYGPWDRLAGNKSFVKGINDKPL